MGLIKQGTLNSIRTDSLKWGTMYLVVRLLERKNLSDYENWIKPSILTLVGFATYHLLVADNLKLGLEGKMNEVANIALKFGTMLLVSAALSGKSMNMNLLINIATQIAGYSMAPLILNDLVKVDLSGANRRVMNDVLFFGGHAVVTQLVNNRNMQSLMNKSFIMELGFRLAGFAAYDFLLA